jgi:uncharacterized protein involved in exopolysaccharide biosynthesis
MEKKETKSKVIITQLLSDNKSLIQTVKDLSDLYYDSKIENERLKEEIQSLDKIIKNFDVNH